MIASVWTVIKRLSYKHVKTYIMFYENYVYYLSYLSSLYLGYPLIVRMTIVMITLLTVITFFGLFRLFFFGFKIFRSNRKRGRVDSKYADKLSFVLSNTLNYDIDELRALLLTEKNETKKYNQELVTDLLLNIKIDLLRAGSLNTINYKNCLGALGLLNFWEKRMRTVALDKRRHVLQVIGEIDHGVNNGVLSKSTYHKDILLRKTARDLYANQDSFNPFQFMEDNFDESFTSLDKIKLHATLLKKSNEGTLPNLLRWINNSKKTDYVVFLFYEIGFFKQYEASPVLIDHLNKQESNLVRTQIIHTLGELNYVEGINALIQRFELENNSVREAIITVLGKLKSKQSFEFLVHTYRSTEDLNLKLRVAKSIICYDSDGESILKLFKEEATTKYRASENVVLDQVFSERNVMYA